MSGSFHSAVIFQPTLEKKDAMRLVFSDAEIGIMRKVKEALDPRGLCNPGKILPD